MTSISRKAASMAGAAFSPAAPISTSVPSKGRARRISFESDFIGCQNPFHAVGDVATGQRRAADVLDVLIEFERCRRILADKLGAPIGVAHFVAVTFPIGQDLDLLDRAVAV